MAAIWIWNSIASRRRSASDVFVENGLGVLATAVREAGHEIRVIDWATGPFYRRLAPPILPRISRALSVWLMKHPGHPRVEGVSRRVMALIAWFQRRRLAGRVRTLAREVAESGLKIFGIKVWYGEAFSWSKLLANEIRRLNPEIVLVAGGYHATLYEEDFLKHSPFDLAVISEGEAALSRILDVISASPARREEKSLTEDNEGNKGAARRGWLRSGLRFLRLLLLRILPATGLTQVGAKAESCSFASSSRDALMGRIREEIAAGRLTNVVYRDGEEIKKTAKGRGDINAKPFPVYGSTEGKVRIHVLLESSGCPWGKCRFCVHQHLEPEYLRRKVEKIVEEIRAMREQGIGLFRFAGSDTPPEFGAAIARGILDAGMRVEYAMGSRAVRGAKGAEVFPVLVEQYALMIRSGLRAVFIGGETGNDRVNESVMNKGLGREDLLWTIRALREAEKRAGRHVDISLAMIYPTPLVEGEGVTLEQVWADDLALATEARPDSVMVTPPGPFKNSEWFRERERYGFKLDPDFVRQMMEWEYVLYKPPELWPKVGFSLNGRDFLGIMKECGRLRAAMEETGLQTDLSDEHFLMLRACGYEGREGAESFKRETLADILSCCCDRLEVCLAMVNAHSQRLSEGKVGGGSLEWQPESTNEVDAGLPPEVPAVRAVS